jgi:hypothetical protein
MKPNIEFLMDAPAVFAAGFLTFQGYYSEAKQPVYFCLLLDRHAFTTHA